MRYLTKEQQELFDLQSVKDLIIDMKNFGFHQAGIVVSFFVGSVVASQLADKWPTGRLLGSGMVFIVLGSVTLVLLIATNQLTAISLVAAYALMTFGMGPMFAVAPSRALRSIKTQAGSASALLSGLEQSIAALSGVAVSLLHDGTARPMAIVTVFLTFILILVIFWIVRQYRSLA